MSRTQPSTGGSKSPIQYYLRFNGETGKLEYYDKDEKKNVVLDDLDFVILDIRGSVTGWNDASESKLYSNMVKNLSKEEITVRSFKGTNKEVAKGFYKEIKDQVEKAGGVYTSNLLSLVKVGKDWEFGNIQLTGSGLATWMTFMEDYPNNKIYDFVVNIAQGEARKKGKINYFVPEFGTKTLPSKVGTQAEEADTELQAYFASYSENAPADTTAPSKKADTSAPKDAKGINTEEEHDDLPF